MRKLSTTNLQTANFLWVVFDPAREAIERGGGGPTYYVPSRGHLFMVTTIAATTPGPPGVIPTIKYTDISLNRITILACSAIIFENNVSYFIFVVCASRESPYCRLYLIFCSDLNNTSHYSNHISHLNVTST